MGAEADDRAVEPDDRAVEPDDRAVEPDDRAVEADDRAVEADDRAVEPIGTLRGAAVEVDARRAGRVASVLGVLALLGSGAGLTAGAAAKNAQIGALRSRGVPVEITVSGCRGLLGGSGSNLAGYSCLGSYELGGTRFVVTVPDGAYHEPGSRIRAIAVPGDPGLVASPEHVASGRPSLRAFSLPALLILGGLAAATGLAARRRRGARGARGGAAGERSGQPAPA